MVTVKYDGRATDDILFDELVQITVHMVEDSEVIVRWKIVEEIEQCQSRNAYAIFEHIACSVVGRRRTVRRWLRGRVVICLPHEKVAHHLHSIVSPHCVTASVFLVGYSFVLESTVERFLGR